MKKTNLLPLLLLSMSIGCGGGRSTEQDIWQLFEDGRYDEAYVGFSAQTQSNPAEAYTGLGWTVLRMDSASRAVYYFSLISHDSIPDAYAGWAFAAWYSNDHTSSLSAGSTVLRWEPQYFFEHDTDINHETITLCQAYNYYAQHAYALCIAKISLLDPLFVAPSVSDPQAPSILLIKLDELSVSLL